MKYLILITILFSNLAFAENWLNHSKILSGSVEAYSLKSDCERVSQEKCFDLGDKTVSVFSEIDESVDDYTKLNYSKSEIQACATNEICDSTFLVKICTDESETKIKNYDLKQVYCSKFLSYEQKLQKTIALDPAKKSAYDAQKVISDLAKSKEASIQFALKRIDCGKRIKALLIVRNSTKGLSKGQVKQINSTYALISSLIDSGSLETAKDEMTTITPDGVLITSADKTDLINEINKCL